MVQILLLETSMSFSAVELALIFSSPKPQTWVIVHYYTIRLQHLQPICTEDLAGLIACAMFGEYCAVTLKNDVEEKWFCLNYIFPLILFSAHAMCIKTLRLVFAQNSSRRSFCSTRRSIKTELLFDPRLRPHFPLPFFFNNAIFL